jgi:UPF0755 protein
MKLKLVILFAFILPGLLFFRLSHSVEPYSKKIEISPGESFSEITNKLKEENLIESKIIFKIYSLLTGRAGKFKPGSYVFSSPPSIFELGRALTNGPSEISVVIAPGATLGEIDDRLALLDVIKAGNLKNFNVGSLIKDYPWLNGNKSLEGFLLPDTYSFFPSSDSEMVARRFLDNFKEKALPFFGNNDNIFKTIILASILEKEIPDYEEQRIAAGILIKRLAINMPLQVDAALIYARCNGKFLNCPPLSGADYKADSPYNTYVYAGLPKGPISNPDVKSIKAVINFKKSDYLYYLSDPKTKNTIFSKTLDEHNENRTKYLLLKRSA